MTTELLAIICDVKPSDFEAEPPAGNGRFELTMAFLAEECPGCGRAGEPGVCPSCGDEIAAPDESNQETEARLAALGPLRDEAEELVARFDAVPAGQIRVSLGQFATAMTDGSLYDRAAEMAGMGHFLAGLDLNDSKTIGTALRSYVDERLKKTRDLLALCEELGAMVPEGPAREARDLAIAAGRHGAELLATYLRLITSRNISEARANEAHLNRLLDGFPPARRMSALLQDLSEAPADDVDERVGRVLRRAGVYTDELGMLAPALVFGAFANEDQPFLALAERARDYFAHLLPTQIPEPELACLLVIPAVTVGSLDRPLRAHRCARLMTELCERAMAEDRRTTQRLIERMSEQGALIFAAASRIDRALRLMEVGERAGLVDEVSALDSIMKAYLELSESTFRAIGWLALDLQRVAVGEAMSEHQIPPTLGELEQKLAASDSELCRELADASDSALRNAAGHAQYTWDEPSEELVDLRTDQRWALDALEQKVHDLVSAVAGSDAGFGCFLVGHAIEIPTPTWARGLGARHAARVVAEASFAAYGYTVETVSSDGGDVVLSSEDEADMLRLLPPLAALGAVCHAPRVFRVRRSDASGELVSVTAEALQKARDAPEEWHDLAIFEALYDAALTNAGDPLHATRGTGALLVKVVAVTSMQQLATRPHAPGAFMRIANRVAYARRFLLDRAESKDAVVEAAVRRLERTKAAAYRARSGKQRDLRNLLSALRNLFRWAESQDAHWPPT